MSLYFMITRFYFMITRLMQIQEKSLQFMQCVIYINTNTLLNSKYLFPSGWDWTYVH